MLDETYSMHYQHDSEHALAICDGAVQGSF